MADARDEQIASLKKALGMAAATFTAIAESLEFNARNKTARPTEDLKKVAKLCRESEQEIREQLAD